MQSYKSSASLQVRLRLMGLIFFSIAIGCSFFAWLKRPEHQRESFYAVSLVLIFMGTFCFSKSPLAFRKRG